MHFLRVGILCWNSPTSCKAFSFAETQLQIVRLQILLSVGKEEVCVGYGALTRMTWILWFCMVLEILVVVGIDTGRKISYQQETLVNEMITCYLSANRIVVTVLEINTLWGKMHQFLLLELLCPNPTGPATMVATMAVPVISAAVSKSDAWIPNKWGPPKYGVSGCGGCWLIGFEVTPQSLRWFEALWSCSLKTKLTQHSLLHREGPSFTAVLKIKDWTIKDCITHSSLRQATLLYVYDSSLGLYLCLGDRLFWY